MLARLVESHIWHPPAGSVGLWREGSERDKASASLSERKLSPALTLISDTSILPCVSLVPFKLLPQCWSSEEVSLNKSVCVLFKKKCLRLQTFLPLPQSPPVFTARSYGGLIFLTLEPWARWPGMGLGLLIPEISLPNFYPPHLSVGPIHSVCPTWMDVVSLIL